jgi:acetyl esterase
MPSVCANEAAPAGAQGLDPDVAAYLALLKTSPAGPLHLCSPEEARRLHEQTAASIPEAVEPVDRVEDGECNGVPIRVYRPSVPVGTTVFVHGGGWVTGSLASYDRLCRILANRSSTKWVSVGYTLAPEAKHPTQLNQVLAVLRETRRTEAGPISLSGDSAGGYLAALAALRVRDEALALASLVLLNPVIDSALTTPSSRQYAEGYRLETEAMRWYWRHFVPPNEEPPSLLKADLAELPPTLVVTAGFDPLHDEGEQFANLVRAAGASLEYRNYAGQVHGFLRLSHAIREARAAQNLVGNFLRRHATPHGATVELTAMS